MCNKREIRRRRPTGGDNDEDAAGVRQFPPRLTKMGRLSGLGKLSRSCADWAPWAAGVGPLQAHEGRKGGAVVIVQCLPESL